MPCPRRPLPAFLAIAMDPIRPDPTLSVKIRALSPKGDRLLDRSVNRSVDKASSSAYLPACLPPRPPACLPAPGVPILNCNSELPIIPMGKRSQALSKAGAGAGAETSSTFLLLIALPPPPRIPRPNTTTTNNILHSHFETRRPSPNQRGWRREGRKAKLGRRRRRRRW